MGMTGLLLGTLMLASITGLKRGTSWEFVATLMLAGAVLAFRFFCDEKLAKHSWYLAMDDARAADEACAGSSLLDDFDVDFYDDDVYEQLGLHRPGGTSAQSI